MRFAPIVIILVVLRSWHGKGVTLTWRLERRFNIMDHSIALYIPFQFWLGVIGVSGHGYYNRYQFRYRLS